MMSGAYFGSGAVDGNFTAIAHKTTFSQILRNSGRDMEGGPRLALMARLAEAIRWDMAVRRHEPDSWSYLRRKLLETEPPFRDFKVSLLNEATEKLLVDLADAGLSEEAMATHREAFEPLLQIGDYADLSFNLDATLAPEARVEGARSILSGAKILTLFDLEAIPQNQRPIVWEKAVFTMARRLQLDVLERIAEKKPLDNERRRNLLAYRARRNLAEFLAVTRGTGGPVMRDEITPFMLGRLEAAVAATIRLLDRWK
jgi:hypothetical protein